ncbi:phosphotriesterase [Pseudonocardia eucalypti]|uniref:Phosphotriesterase n=1 Tax=Pseudonocardia eucalypti TaxID=648755 RepID=A0ABP9RDH9_9PSEU|nr:phosphotriesterase-related protein [Pseudonocardia eucalypti]
MRVVRTVRADVPPERIGHTQTHEHVLSKLASVRQGSMLDSAEAIRLDNYYEVRRHHSVFDLTVNDVEDAVAELGEYAAHGGSAMVDATSIGIGRDPEGLLAVAERTGVHIVMGAGYYQREFHPAGLDDRSRADLAAEMSRDVTEGVGERRIRSGVIGEIGLSWPVHPVERRVLEAACDAQRDTGAALLVHPGRHADAPLDAMRIIRAVGGDQDRVIMSHIDRTLFDLPAMVELAETGCYLEFDLFGQESSYYPFADIDMPNDATRVDHLVALRGRGFGRRLLVAQDICSKTHLRRYGGEGYAHLIRNVLPLMRRKGLDDAAIGELTVANPREALAFAA